MRAELKAEDAKASANMGQDVSSDQADGFAVHDEAAAQPAHQVGDGQAADGLGGRFTAEAHTDHLGGQELGGHQEGGKGEEPVKHEQVKLGVGQQSLESKFIFVQYFCGVLGQFCHLEICFLSTP